MAKNSFLLEITVNYRKYISWALGFIKARFYIFCIEIQNILEPLLFKFKLFFPCQDSNYTLPL